ncbi:MAG TPA: hypothetical protein VEJ63_17835 [Planctomycetota bacterium]|nr:hypothetical protein [Planctomycetota bacterium]
MRLALVVFGLASLSLQADTVVLKTGQSMDGKVLKQDDNGIELEVEYGTILIAQDKILRIEAETPEMAEAREKKEAEKREFADKMRAEGKVPYKGKWVTEKEKKADEEKIAAAKKKKAEELAAKRKAQEEADKKKREEEERLAAERERQQQTVAQEDNRLYGRRNSRDRNRDRDTRDNRDWRGNVGSQIDNSDFARRIQDTLRRSGIRGGDVEQLINDNVRRRN